MRLFAKSFAIRYDPTRSEQKRGLYCFRQALNSITGESEAEGFC